MQKTKSKKDQTLSTKLNLLNRFKLQAEKMERYPEFFENIKAGFNVTKEKIERHITKGATDDRTLFPIIATFRPFYMLEKNSDLNFEYIAKVLLSEPKFVEYHSQIQKYLYVWNQLIKPEWNPGMVIKIEHEEWSSKKLFNVWMNEAYVHQEQYKPKSGKGLDALKLHPIMELSSQFFFVDLLQRFVKLVILFNKQIVKKILDSKDNSMI